MYPPNKPPPPTATWPPEATPVLPPLPDPRYVDARFLTDLRPLVLGLLALINRSVYPNQKACPTCGRVHRKDTPA